MSKVAKLVLVGGIVLLPFADALLHCVLPRGAMFVGVDIVVGLLTAWTAYSGFVNRSYLTKAGTVTSCICMLCAIIICVFLIHRRIVHIGDNAVLLPIVAWAADGRIGSPHDVLGANRIGPEQIEAMNERLGNRLMGVATWALLVGSYSLVPVLAVICVVLGGFRCRRDG